MGIKIDWNEMEDSGGFTLIDEGTYGCEVVDMKLSDKPGDSGFHWIKFTFGKIEGQGEKRLLWSRPFSLSPKALWALKEALTSLGVDVPEGEFELERDEVVGQKCQVVVKHVDHWQGKKDPATGEIQQVEEVSDILPPAEGQAFGWN